MSVLLSWRGLTGPWRWSPVLSLSLNMNLGQGLLPPRPEFPYFYRIGKAQGTSQRRRRTGGAVRKGGAPSTPPTPTSQPGLTSGSDTRS